jgi:hypothetical protein
MEPHPLLHLIAIGFVGFLSGCAAIQGKPDLTAVPRLNPPAVTLVEEGDAAEIRAAARELSDIFASEGLTTTVSPSPSIGTYVGTVAEFDEGEAPLCSNFRHAVPSVLRSRGYDPETWVVRHPLAAPRQETCSVLLHLGFQPRSKGEWILW